MSEAVFEQDHVWTGEQMAAALAGGLAGEDLARFDSHLRSCSVCREQWEQLRQRDQALLAAFEDAQMREGLEDRIIGRLRREPMRRRLIHPAVKYVATGIAATIVVGGFGLIVNSAIERGGLPDLALLAQARRAPAARYSATGAVTGASPATQPAWFWSDGQSVRYGDGHSDWDKSSPAPEQRDKLYESTEAYGLGWRLLGDSSGASVTPAARQPLSVDAIRQPTGGVVISGGTLKVEPELKAKGSELAKTQPMRMEGSNFYGGFQLGTSNRDANTAKESGAFKPSDLRSQGGESGSRSSEKINAVSGAGAVAGQPAPAQPSTPALVPAGASAPAAAVATEPEPARETRAATRKIIRNGQMEFEVDRFDSAFAIVTKVIGEAGGYVSSTDSEKLPNGKVKGTVGVRVTPEKLDTVVLQLRGLGDLKSQKLEAQDVSKQYHDLDSELTADRAMETRLLEIIKTGKGSVKELLEAEKELAVWRGKIEKIVGQMKYYDNLVAMSTLSLTLYERDIKTAAAAIETETIDTGVETSDVEKSRADALKAIEEAKGRVIQSDLKRYDAGQFGATIVAEVAADRSGALLDRMKQLGKVARLDISRKQTDGAAGESTRVERKETRFNISIYNLANVAPRVTTNVNLAAEDAEGTYRSILSRVEKAGGRVVSSNLNREKATQVSGTIALEVPAAESDAMVSELKKLGEVMKLTVTENPDAANVTTAKRGFNVQVASLTSIAPRETAAVSVAAENVAQAREQIVQAASSIGGRVLNTNLNESDRQNVTATVDTEVRREKLADFEKAVAAAGEVQSRSITRSADADNTVDTKVRVQLSLMSAERVAPRLTTSLGVEVRDVESAVAQVQADASGAGGRVVSSNLSKDRDGRTVGRVTVEVPLGQAQAVTDQARKLGTVRMFETSRNQQATEGKLARARLEITFGNAEAIVEPGKGVWASVRQALSTSAAGLLWSLQIVIIGLCFVLPWVALVWGGWRVVGRKKKPTVGGV
ncbi:MAG TPA: DUF4349 domain-containing protein [Tepidisphaeraceae bacterium]|jgi:hypothetical protein